MKMEDLSDWTTSPPSLPSWNPKRDSIALKKWRTHKGWSLVQLGQVLGTTHAQVSQIENGKRKPSGSMRRIFQLLEAWKP